MTNQTSAKKTLKVNTNLKAGGISVNHVEVGLREPKAKEAKTLKIRTNLKAGGITINHVEVALKAK